MNWRMCIFFLTAFMGMLCPEVLICDTHTHIHANTQDDFFPLIVARDRMLNAGVDINGFRPVTFEELLENNIRFKENWRRENGKEI